MIPEYECPKCGEKFTDEQYKESRFCSECGTLLRKCRPPRYWIFQFNPRKYRWFDWIKENEGKTEQWLTSQHSKEIHKGDKVVVWASGPKAGVYAIGEILTNPKRKPLNQEQKKYWNIKTDVFKFLSNKSVIVKYSKIITDNPLLKGECEQDPILSGMPVLKGIQATNIPIGKRYWDRILELLHGRVL
ncbi:hypothetical protein DRO56_04830 [Candidatus Bathyarchaeota archaeon]|nr:MAG: hypothetical protein DRO56_04830 [Candidatus Bathyarchaeota archaeon]